MKNLENFTARELASKHAYLMEEIEQLPPGTKIPLDKKKERIALEEELQRRLYRSLISDVLPVIVTAAKNPDAIKPIEKKIIIPFHFEVFSSLNTRIDRFKVDAPTKEEAWKEAEEKAKKYPGNINLRIS